MKNLPRDVKVVNCRKTWQLSIMHFGNFFMHSSFLGRVLLYQRFDYQNPHAALLMVLCALLQCIATAVLTLQQAIIFSHLKEDVAYFLKLPIKHQTAKLSFVQEDEDIFNPFKIENFSLSQQWGVLMIETDIRWTYVLRVPPLIIACYCLPDIYQENFLTITS